jgi:hypothetical protein
MDQKIKYDKSPSLEKDSSLLLPVAGVLCRQPGKADYLCAILGEGTL